MSSRLLGGVLLVVAVVATALWGVHRAVGFGGQTIVADFRHPARFVGDLKPVGRRDEAFRVDGTWRTRLTSSPVFVDFAPPASFAELALGASFVPGEVDEVVVGALTPEPNGQFAVRSVYHAGLQRLAASGWTTITEDGMTLYQRQPTYTSLKDFASRPPATSDLAVYRTPPPATVVPAAVDEGSQLVIPVVLRGSHRFVTVVDSGTLDVAFATQDMNREEGPDVAVLSVYPLAGGPAVASLALEDDKNERNDQVSTGLRPLRVSARVPNGVYRVELRMTDDVFVREIVTSQRRFAALGRVFLGDSIGYSDRVPTTTLIANGSELVLTGPHPESAQTVRVGGEGWNVGGGYEGAVRGQLTAATTSVAVPDGDLLVETNGQLAFAAGGLVPGLPFEVGALTSSEDLAARGIDYVLAAYVPPQCAAGTCRAAAPLGQLPLHIGNAPTGAHRVSLDVPVLRLRPVAGPAATPDFFLESLTFSTARAPKGVLSTLVALPRLLRAPERFVTEPPLSRAFYEAID